MAKMRAIDAAVRVLEREGVTHAFGVPGAAINPLYSAMKARGSITHVLARHVEGASHMPEGYTRAVAGNIGVCIGTSGPAGTDMITGLYSAQADSIPILCITGQAPRARLYKEDFQAVDIESIAKPVTKWAVTVREPAQVPRAFQQAFHLMRGGHARADREGARDAERGRQAADRRRRRRHQRRRLRAARGIRRDDRRAGDSYADGLGHHCRRPSADGGHVRAADVASLRQCDDARLRFRARHRQPLGEPPHRLRRRLHEGPQVRSRRHRADADRPRVRP